MRLSILAFPSAKHSGLTPVLNACSSKGHLDRELTDRTGNEDAFEGERVVRLPRRLSREIIARTWAGGYSTDSVDINRTLQQGRVLLYGEDTQHARGCNCSDCCSRLSDPYLYG